MQIQIVINTCYGGFSLSRKACEWLVNERGRSEYASKLKGENYGSFCRTIERTDPDLIACIENLGWREASGNCAALKIETIHFDPMDLVEDHDGYESIH